MQQECLVMRALPQLRKKKADEEERPGVIGNVTSFGTIGSKVVECQEKKVAQARLAPHECSNALAHTTQGGVAATKDKFA